MGKEGLKISRVINVLLIIVFLLAATLTIVLTNAHLRREAVRDAENRAQILLDRNLATHHYFTGQIKPTVHALLEKENRRVSFDPTWMSSTYAVRQINDLFGNLHENDVYYYKECAVNARSPENEADPIERKFLAELNAHPDLTARSELREIDGEICYVLMQRGEVIVESCLRCHSNPSEAPPSLVDLYGDKSSFNREVGETASAISIRIPLSREFQRVDTHFLHLSFVFAGIFLVVFTIQFFLQRHFLFRPLKVIRDKARLISSDSSHLGETIEEPTGRELSEVTSAFNAMSSSLHHQIEHLEDMVEQRTRALQEANRQLREDLEARAENELSLRNRERHYNYLAHHDPLTNLANRLLFEARLEQAFNRSNRFGHLVCLLFLDLDHFKDINDAFGHAAGDELLKGVAERLSSCLRHNDTLARLAGDEFAIVLEDLNTPEDGEVIAAKIISALDPPFDIFGHSIRSCISIGLCFYPRDAESPEDAMRKADGAMYRAKKSGGRRCHTYLADL